MRTQIGKEVHLEGVGELRRRSEGNVDVLMEHLRDVRTRHFHALRKLRLRHPQLLHPEQNAAEERGTDFIYCIHSLQPTFGSPGGRKLRVEELGVEELTVEYSSEHSPKKKELKYCWKIVGESGIGKGLHLFLS